VILVSGHPTEQQQLIEALQDPGLYDHFVAGFEVIETHVSWVILTGSYAYKIKKPVDFGFLDFSTLDKRRFNCIEELRLNSRLAPQIYLELVTINGSPQNVELNGRGPVIEYAVKMVQFPQEAQLDCLPEKGGLDAAIISQLAETVAQFHLLVNSAPQSSDWGAPNHILATIEENFHHIRSCAHDSALISRLGELEQWSRRQVEMLMPLAEERKAGGYVRECHGDMHLRNIALWNNEIIIFDCIEFNKGLRFIDVISEIAFLIMDLEARQKCRLAMRFLNAYMEITGDFEGLQLLRLYKVYRALVRAKVDILRTEQEQPGSTEHAQTVAEFYRYLELAESYIRPSYPMLVISHGVSGTGKSEGTRGLADRLGGIQLRSDVERKRRRSNSTIKGCKPQPEKNLYTAEITDKTYRRLAELAHSLLAAGYPVVIDATNLKAEQRRLFADVAALLDVPLHIVSFTASVDTLRRRVEKRSQDGSDISDADLVVLEQQLATCEPLSEVEQISTFEINTELPMDLDVLAHSIQKEKKYTMNTV